MARMTKVVLVCDRHRDEVEAAGTIEFVIDGERRTLDLCAEHLAEVRHAIAPWLHEARSASAGRAGESAADPKRKRPYRSPDAAAVRTWARQNGFDIPDRGRLSAEVRAAYAAAQ